ncbi:LLM class flavin-dependent oxidoreductase [Mycolicibacterium litorale]|uniref:LLM class flavin-dependent oxidoreductase n=1 Tax=Mycolicibacterium litorale TaxID=758802 RepID=UPI003CE765C7
MDVGLFLNTQWLREERASVGDVTAQARSACDAGFTSVWLPHHYLTAPMQMMQPFTLLGYLVAETGDMQLGMDILVLPLLNPTLVAEEWATLDVLSGGRAVLGVGLGSRPEEFEAFGVPRTQRASRMAESVEVIRRLWAEDRVTFSGKHYQITDAGVGLRPVQSGGPPIYIAAMAEAALERAARIGDGWLIQPTAAVAEVTEQVAVYRKALDAHGKAAETPALLTRECYIGSSYKTALEECRPALQAKYQAYASWGSVSDARLEKVPSFEEYAEDRFLIGDEASVADDIARISETLGVDRFLMRTQWIGLPIEQGVRTIEALGRIFA